jgi:hypothetical protein
VKIAEGRSAAHGGGMIRSAIDGAKDITFGHSNPTETESRPPVKSQLRLRQIRQPYRQRHPRVAVKRPTACPGVRGVIRGMNYRLPEQLRSA